MKNNIFDTIKKFLIFIFVTSLIILLVLLLINLYDSKLINDIKDFTKSGTKILYISDKDSYSDYSIELLEKYEIEYLYIDSSILSGIEKSKIKKIIANKEINNIILIYKNGKIIDILENYLSKQNILEFLQKYNIIPNIIGDTSKIIEETKKHLVSDMIMLYIPYRYDDTLIEQDLMLKEISNEYNIKYNMINAYLLSYTQQEKLNSLLQISSVENQIVILVKDKKIIGSIRDINTKNTYLNKLYDYKFISDIENYINNITYIEFENLLKSQDLNITLITKNDCKYCEVVNNTLNKLAIDYNIKVNSININNLETEVSALVEKRLIELGYLDGFTTPLTIITQSNKIIDYIIGASDEKYFVDIFKENGIIK